MSLKIQYVRFCQTCKTQLGLNCRACVRHPERKPKVLTYYEIPPILEVCPCRAGVRIACQRLGCTKTSWHHIKHQKAGKIAAKNLFCSRQCALAHIVAARLATRIKAPCGYCHKIIERPPGEVKNFKAIYCHREHYTLARIKATHLEQECEDGKSLLQCRGKCNGIVTEHHAKGNKYTTCVICGAVRSTRYAVSTISDLVAGKRGR